MHINCLDNTPAIIILIYFVSLGHCLFCILYFTFRYIGSCKVKIFQGSGRMLALFSIEEVAC
jgi:hypothetical protein